MKLIITLAIDADRGTPDPADMEAMRIASKLHSANRIILGPMDALRISHIELALATARPMTRDHFHSAWALLVRPGVRETLRGVPAEEIDSLLAWLGDRIAQIDAAERSLTDEPGEVFVGEPPTIPVWPSESASKE